MNGQFTAMRGNQILKLPRKHVKLVSLNLKPFNSYMNVHFNYQHVSGSDSLEEFTEEKLKPIFERYNWVTRADVFFRNENTSSDNTGMIVNIRLSAPGPRLYAEESHDTFKESVSKVVDQLKRQCEKRKSELSNHN
jgi:putative sigma-54 modulation protein